MFASPPQQSHGQTVVVRLLIALLFLLVLVPMAVIAASEPKIDPGAVAIAAGFVALYVVLWVVIGNRPSPSPRGAPANDRLRRNGDPLG